MFHETRVSYDPAFTVNVDALGLKRDMAESRSEAFPLRPPVIPATPNQQRLDCGFITLLLRRVGKAFPLGLFC